MEGQTKEPRTLRELEEYIDATLATVSAERELEIETPRALWRPKNRDYQRSKHFRRILDKVRERRARNNAGE